MSRIPDHLFKAEYIKNVLYFAVVKQGKFLNCTEEVHYFCIDDELVYENYYSDFGPLNLGCVYKYCRILNDKLKQHLNKKLIVHYTSSDPRKKTNSAFLLGCYGILYLSLTPRDALKPLINYGQSYRPFQDATQEPSQYTISLLDCLLAMKKARDLGFFNFNDFDYEEYDRLDKIQGGDLNWIIPTKFLAFIGPVDYSVSLYHPPEMYIDYFLENDVRIVIRLNKKMYDGNVFSDVGITHYDLFFPDGSCPPRRRLFEFLHICEESNCAIAVHCKAGLGRTGSLIGCYLIKHYRMSSHEAIGWMRICRPGSVIGHQQAWLEQLEPWLQKQGDLYRKRKYQDPDRLPHHEYGLYSVTEKIQKQRPVVLHKSPSPPPSMQALRPVLKREPVVRPQNSKVKEDLFTEDEIFLTSIDLTEAPRAPRSRKLKGCIIMSNGIEAELETNNSCSTVPLWKKCLCFKSWCNLNDALWKISVRCAKVTPKRCNTNKCCNFLDLVAFNKEAEKEYENRLKSQISNTRKYAGKGDRDNDSKNQQSTAASGDLKPGKLGTMRSIARRTSDQSNEIKPKYQPVYYPITALRTSQPPVIKSVNDAKNFLLQSSMYANERAKQVNAAVTAKKYPLSMTYHSNEDKAGQSHTSYNKASKPVHTPNQRRRLGRSPSPPARRVVNEQNRATNTPSPTEQFLLKDASKTALKDVLSRLKLITSCRNSLGAASLGASRDSPAPRRDASVRSDVRPLATQGDMLNSIKLQRRFRGNMNLDSNTVKDRAAGWVSKQSSAKTIISRDSSTKNLNPKDCCTSGEKSNFAVRSPHSSDSPSRMFHNSYPQRPMSPKGRRTPPF